MKKPIIFLLLIKCNLVMAGDAVFGSTLYSLDLSSDYSCYTMTPADFQRIKKLRHLVAKPEQLEIYVKTTLPLRTNFSEKEGLVYQSLQDKNKLYISGINTLLKIGAEDPTVPGSNEIWQTKSRDYLVFLGELQAGVPYMLASSVDKGYVFWFGEAISTK